MKSAIIDEFNRAPVATVTAVIGSVAGAGSLWLALYPRPTPGAAVPAASAAPATIISNTSLSAICFYLCVTVVSAIVARLLSRNSQVTRVALSLVGASLANFLFLYYCQLQGVGQVVGQTHKPSEMVSFMTPLIYLSIYAEGIRQSFLRSVPDTAEDAPTVGGVLFVAGIVLLIWTELVSVATRRLAGAFLQLPT